MISMVLLAALPELAPAFSEVRALPPAEASYEYVVTGAVRIGFFWLSRDDIGLGRIRTGRGQESEFIQLVLGSVPAKAPFGINRWGIATEIASPVSSVFFGLMTPTEESSLAAARGDIARDGKSGTYPLQVLIGQSSPSRAVSSGWLMNFERAWQVTEAAALEAEVLARLEAAARPPRTANHACPSPGGLLFAVRDLLATGGKSPQSRCYVYHARPYTLTLTGAKPVRERTLSIQFRGAPRKAARTYTDLRETEFEILNHATGRKTRFELLVSRAGIPVQVVFRPNWWFRLSMTLSPADGSAGRR